MWAKPVPVPGREEFVSPDKYTPGTNQPIAKIRPIKRLQYVYPTLFWHSVIIIPPIVLVVSNPSPEVIFSQTRQYQMWAKPVVVPGPPEQVDLDKWYRELSTPRRDVIRNQQIYPNWTMSYTPHIFIVPAKSLGYRIIVKDADGNKLGEVIPRKMKFSKKLNDYGQAEWDIRVADTLAATLINLRVNTVEVYRENDTTNTLVWAGEQAIAVGELNEEGDNWANVHCFTWFEQLYHRYTLQEVAYSTIDQGAIAEDLIDDTNADDPTKITTGTIVPTTLRDRVYYNQNIAEAIINLANVSSGFDFEVTDLGVFNADSIIGNDKTDDVVFRYGHNIQNVTVIEDFSSPINRAIVLGEAIGETSLSRVEREDATSQTAYGLREGRLQELDISGISTLEDKGDAALRKYAEPLIKVQFDLVRNITPSIDQFTIGDGIRLIVQDGMYNIDEQYRVFEWEVTYDERSTETLKLVLGKFITI